MTSFNLTASEKNYFQIKWHIEVLGSWDVDIHTGKQTQLNPQCDTRDGVGGYGIEPWEARH